MQSALERMLAQDNAADGPLPDPPSTLDDQARVKWLEIVPLLQARGDVDQGTLDALLQYCSAWSRWRAADAQVATLGIVLQSPRGVLFVNPWVSVAEKAQRQVRQWAQELGITPLGRKKLKV